jgi:hypothetical protein
MSTRILRAQVGPAETVHTPDGDSVIHTLTPLGIFKTDAPVGAPLRVTGLDGYHRPGNAAGWVPLQRGDIVYLFLVPRDKARYTKDQKSGADAAVLESGVRLLLEGDVYAFGQYIPRPERAPGPPARIPAAGFVTMLPDLFPGAPLHSQASFEEQLQSAMKTSEKIAALLDAKPSPDTAAAAIALIKDRRPLLKSQLATTDALGALLVQKLLQDAPPAALLDLQPDLPRNVQSQVAFILQKQAGREYLLARVADAAEPMARRVQMANLLAAAGHTYMVEVNAPGSVVPRDFATRLARLAATSLDTPLAESLLRGVAGCSGAPEEDTDAAGTLLAAAIADARGITQFRLAEALMQVSLRQYRVAMPQAAGILTLIEPAPTFDAALKQRRLEVTASFRSTFPRGTPPGDVKLILEPVAGTGTVEISVDSRIGTMPATFGRSFPIDASIPKGTPSGRYHAYLRVNIYGPRDGLGFEFEIPK